MKKKILTILLIIITVLLLFSLKVIRNVDYYYQSGDLNFRVEINKPKQVNVNYVDCIMPPTISIFEEGAIFTEPFIPTRIRIDSVDIDAEVVPVGITGNVIEAPQDSDMVGWYKESGKVGENKTAIMDGHYDSKFSKAVFYNLQYLDIGDKIQVYSEKGESLVYIVTALESYAKDNVPKGKIFDNDGTDRLNLITCSGNFDKGENTYLRRLIVYTERLES